LSTWAEEVNLDTIDITNPTRYRVDGYPWREWDMLRREAPVYWYQRTDFEPFWAITKHADVVWVSRNPHLFSNRQVLRPEPVERLEAVERLRERQAELDGGSPDGPRDLLEMDPPEHRRYRKLMATRFTPRAIAELEDKMNEVAGRHVETFVARLRDRARSDPTHDGLNLEDVMARLPFEMICHMADVPERTWDSVYDLATLLSPTRAGDPDHRNPGETLEDAMQRVRAEWQRYTEELVLERQAAGSDGHDLLSVLLRAELDGEPLATYEVAGYFRLLISAGTGTTREAMTAGLKALLEHRGELERLIDDPSLIPTAIEEMLRWGSIITCFQRTCMEDVELRGERIRQGESVVIFLPSANRDEDVFDEPYRFDAGRDPNPHVAFGGYGEHICLGINLARWEMRAMLRALLPLLPDLELAGPPERIDETRLHIPAFKRVPVRLKTDATA
jgi:cholest-4-en-3-one 26-monooxygenase